MSEDGMSWTGTLAVEGHTHQIIACEGRVRWVPVREPDKSGHRLEQLFSITSFKNGMVTTRREEWRRVPVETDN